MTSARIVKRAVLTLREWEAAEASLSTADAVALREGPGGISVDPVEPGVYRITPSHHVGSLVLPDSDVVIQPKVGVRRLFFLLGYSRRLRFREVPVRLGESPELTETIVRAFVQQARVALRRGPLQGYQTVDDSLTTIRGRVRMLDQARRRFAMPLPMEVTYDEFTMDIAENRLLKAALRRIERLRLRDDRLKPLARELLSSLDVVADVRIDRRSLADVSITRLNRHYEQAIGLARLIVAFASADLVHGGAPVPSFVIDMDKVFEDFVYRVVGDALKLRRGRWRQGKETTLDVRGRVAIKPDLSIWVGKRCTFVGDVKYKVTDIGENDDLYQVLSYARATGVREAVLVYASAAREADQHVVRHDGTTLHVRYIDLEANDDAIFAAATELAKLIRRIHAASRGGADYLAAVDGVLDPLTPAVGS